MVKEAEVEYKRYTVEEYLELENKSEQKHEFVNGKIIPMSGASSPHNLISISIATYLKLSLKKKDIKYYVMGSDMKILIKDFNQVRYPDAVVVCKKLEHADTAKTVLLNPLLIVEVLSPSTEQFDKGAKFHEYKTIPSFNEYVLVHQDRPYVTTFFKEENDLWRIQDTIGLDKKVQLKSLDVTLALQDIYEDVELEIS